jgi:glycine/sarcosine N-methyltransferase
MDFYTELSRYYDVIFRVSPETVDFLHSHILEKAAVLDIACGTGSHAIELSARGHNVIGVDLDPDMIDQANRKLTDGNGTVEKNLHPPTFYTGSMLDIETIIPGDRGFTLVYCIGNSVVHLESFEEITSFFSTAHRLLAPGERFIVQIVNFDRVLGRGLHELPEINRENGRFVFKRFYSYERNDQKVLFSSELRVKEAGEEKQYLSSVPLLILESNKLVSLLENAGFEEIELFGNFKGKPYSIESPGLIAAAINK